MILLSKSLRFPFVFFAIVIGLYPLLYFIADMSAGYLSSKPAELLTDKIWQAGFYTHITFGGISLLTGWSQFSKKIRAKNISFHRSLGKIYIISVLMSGSAAVYLSFFAIGGIISSAGFFLLGSLWLFSTLKAYLEIREKRTKFHRRWMIISYALCFAAVTLRLWTPVLALLPIEFNTSFQIVAWLCWVPNLIVALLVISTTNNKTLHYE